MTIISFDTLKTFNMVLRDLHKATVVVVTIVILLIIVDSIIKEMGVEENPTLIEGDGEDIDFIL